MSLIPDSLASQARGEAADILLKHGGLKEGMSRTTEGWITAAHDLALMIVDEIGPLLYVDDADIAEEARRAGFREGEKSQEGYIASLVAEGDELRDAVEVWEQEFIREEEEHARTVDERDAALEELTQMEAEISKLKGKLDDIQDHHEKVDDVLRR